MKILNNAHSHFSSIILSAGLSNRMKTCKQVLPWGKTTVLGAIISVFKSIPIDQIIVVSGGYRELVETESSKYNVEIVFNNLYQNENMLDSVKTGLEKVYPNTSGVFIALGDQPLITIEDISGLMALSLSKPDNIIIPSYNFHRGHPWLLPRKFIHPLKNFPSSRTMKDFIHVYESEISYYIIKSSIVLSDLDTPEEYEQMKPN